MPKGVEHQQSAATAATLKLVSFPVMPKGVEHKELGFNAFEANG